MKPLSSPKWDINDFRIVYIHIDTRLEVLDRSSGK